MAEWFKATVLKTVVGQLTVSSNLTTSAKNRNRILKLKWGRAEGATQISFMGKQRLEPKEIEQIEFLVKESNLYLKAREIFNEFLSLAEKSYYSSVTKTEGKKYFNEHIAHIKSKLNWSK